MKSRERMIYDDEYYRKRQTLVIKSELPDLNSYINTERSNKFAAHQLKKKATRAVQHEINLQISKFKVKKFKRIYLYIDYYCKDKRKDMDNVAFAKKFILDGMVNAKVIPNDGWKQIAGWEERFYIDKNNPRIEILLVEPAD